MTKRERELKREIEAHRETQRQLANAKRELTDTHAEYWRYDAALNQLMRAVLHEASSDLAIQTSIASGRLIEAVRAASQTVHDRSKP